jgi:hypothetical protein
MMSGMPLETCWAFSERWNKEFYYKVATCWLFILIQRRSFKAWTNFLSLISVPLDERDTAKECTILNACQPDNILSAFLTTGWWQRMMNFRGLLLQEVSMFMLTPYTSHRHCAHPLIFHKPLTSSLQSSIKIYGTWQLWSPWYMTLSRWKILWF